MIHAAKADASATSVRDRMAATGEDYPTALQAIQAERGAEQQPAAGAEAWRTVPWCAPASEAGQEVNRG